MLYLLCFVPGPGPGLWVENNSYNLDGDIWTKRSIRVPVFAPRNMNRPYLFPEWLIVVCWKYRFRAAPPQHSDLRASRQSVKWRTAVGGGSLLGLVGSPTRAAGGERAGYGSLPLSELAPGPTRTRMGSARALTPRYKFLLPSATTCRNFGMFLERRVAPAAGR